MFINIEHTLVEEEIYYTVFRATVSITDSNWRCFYALSRDLGLSLDYITRDAVVEWQIEK
jgi:hypothetical protein